MTLTYRFFGLITAFGALLLAPGCHQAELDIGTTSEALSCPLEQCGINSPDWPVTEEVRELHLRPDQNTGHLNQHGFRIDRFEPPNDSYTGCILEGSFGRLEAKCHGGVKLEKDGLIGSRIYIVDATGEAALALVVFMYEQSDSWSAPVVSIDQYGFAIEDNPDSPPRPLCDGATTAGALSNWAVILSRERYNWDHYSIIASDNEAPGWFNIACMGNALYKMKMSGYDSHPTPGHPHPSTVEQRGAMFKMLVGDYCGRGESFTVAGTPLQWQDTVNFSNNYGNELPGGFEAHWGAGGAMCLDTPRLGSSMYQTIVDACAEVGRVLQPCDGDMDIGQHSDWVTYVPSIAQ